MAPSAHAAPTARPDASGASGALDAQRSGKVEVSAHAIATIAAQATIECYGVVGIASRRPRPGAVQRLAPEESARGVEVRFVEDHVVIEVGVILEHRLRVVEVAHNIMVIVKYAVEQALGLHVVQVNVNVQALRVRE
jgi:uncharacterized alkaline shock family protein YloU